MDDELIRSVLLVAFFALLLIASGMFSGTETALFSLDRVQRRRLQEERSIRAQLITRALRRPRQLFSTILFGNTLVNVATSAVATLIFDYVLHSHSTAAVIALDLCLVLLFGEIIPKTIAVNAALPVSLVAITPSPSSRASPPPW